jgi:hypothetical protein
MLMPRRWTRIALLISSLPVGATSMSSPRSWIACTIKRVTTLSPGYLTNLEGRGIVGPDREPLWPDTESLRWHRENVLRTR